MRAYESSKKTKLKPHLKKSWCIGRITPEFVWHVEDALHQKQVYALVEERNRIEATVNWSFTRTNARQNLERRYPTITN
jgi:hypothetical protein